MDTLTLIGIAIALAMDAFAVALAAGLTLTTVTYRHLFRFGFHFGLFQGLMPVLGWMAGVGLRHYMEAFSHWLAFVLLSLIGIKMLHDALTDAGEDAEPKDPTRGISLVMLSIATSIDALAVGFSLALLGVSIWMPALIIGATASVFTLVGMLLGQRIGALWSSKIECAGGLLLIAIGLKILLENTLFN
jgi:putative Mn2+ efflux pump MntP